MRARTRVLGPVLVALTTVVAPGCGVPIDDDPRALPRDEVPFGLLGEPTTTTVPAESGTVLVVFLVDDGRLVRAQRRTAERPTVEGALEALVAGPSGADSGRGIRTAITPGASIDIVAVEPPAVLLDLDASFLALDLDEQIVAMAQLVFTVTDVPGIERVAFTALGEAVAVPAGDGTLTDGPLGRADFARFAPAS